MMGLNGLDLLVLGCAVGAAGELLHRAWRKRVRRRRLLPPNQAVIRDRAPVLPPLPPKAIFEMHIPPENMRVITGGAPDPMKSVQAEAYDRWQVSDECDPHKLPGASAHLSVNESSWREEPYASRVRQHRQENKWRNKR
jgi:hypothetical protein